MRHTITVEEFAALLKLIYEADPWPVTDEGANSVTENEATVKAWANKEALNRGYDSGWDAHCKLNRKG